MGLLIQLADIDIKSGTFITIIDPEMCGIILILHPDHKLTSFIGQFISREIFIDEILTDL